MPHKKDHKKDLVEKAFNTFFSGRIIGASGDKARERNAMVDKIRKGK